MTSVNQTQNSVIIGGIDISTSQAPFVADVTPKMAKQMLEHNTINRQQSSAKVANYVTDMLNGNWHPGAARVAFNVNGELENGQHTLQAIVDSKTTQSLLLQCGVAVGFGNFVDIGKARTLEDALTMRAKQSSKSTSYVKQIAADTDRLHAGLHPKPAEQKPTMKEKILFAENNEALLTEIVKIFASAKNGRNKAVFRSGFQYWALKNPLLKTEVSRLAAQYVEGKCQGHHPLKKFDRWYDEYSRRCKDHGSNIDTFKVYSMILSAIEMVVVEGKDGVKYLRGKETEELFQSKLFGKWVPEYPAPKII